jgi:hypothetical protein
MKLYLVAELFFLWVNCLSLTLRDAQHLCWKTFRKLELMNASSGPSKVDELLAMKAKELSEKAQSGNASDKLTAAKLLSELLYFAFVLAEQRGVDLEESFLQSIDELILGSVT